MKQPKLTLCLVFLVLSATINAQTPNIVPNSSFEEYSLCPQDYTHWNSIYRRLTDKWIYPTKGTPDYFNKCSRGIAGVPRNFAGTSMPYTGNAYIGIVSRGSRNNYREYVEAKLTDSLEAGVTYCVKFKYKLSSYSRYAIDRLGVYFSPYQIRLDNDGYLNVTPQVTNPKEVWLDNKIDWGEFCGSFVASGKEKDILIGNFYSDDSTDVVETDISDVYPKRVKDYAYYYLDDVEVHAIKNCYVCSCSKENTIEAEIKAKAVHHFGGNDGSADLTILYGEPPFKYEWSNGETTEDVENLSAGFYFVEVSDAKGCKYSFETTVEQPDSVFASVDKGMPKRLKNVLFYFDKTDFLPSSFKQLNDLVYYMQDNPTIKIKILGHTDERGKGKYNMDLSERRAKKVVDFLIEKGISANRLSYKGYGESRPLTDNKTEKGRQLNRRVEFQVEN